MPPINSLPLGNRAPILAGRDSGKWILLALVACPESQPILVLCSLKRNQYQKTNHFPHTFLPRSGICLNYDIRDNYRKLRPWRLGRVITRAVFIGCYPADIHWWHRAPVFGGLYMLIFLSKISRLHLLALHAIKNCNSYNCLFSHCHFGNGSYVLVSKGVSRLFLGCSWPRERSTVKFWR